MVVVRAELLLKNSRTLNKDSRPAESDVIFTRGLLSIRAPVLVPVVLVRWSRQLLMYPASRSFAARLAHADRYSLIHSFFTRPRPPTPLIRPISSRSSIPTSTLRRTFYYSSHPSHYKPFSTCATSHSQQSPQQPTHTSHQNSPNLDSPPHSLYDNNYPRFFRRLAQSLPHVSRPSRDDFLNAANGFVQRMRVRVRWFFIRNFRKFNADDISAFVTWFLVGHGLWILIGTSVLTTWHHSAPSADHFQNDIFFCCVCSSE